jgi:restriction system protein
MARRRKSGIDLAFQPAAKLPWKVSVVLAPVSYGVLHIFATLKPPAASSLDQMDKVVIGSVISTLCAIGQYVLPAILLTGAVVSFLEARKHSHRFELTAERGQRSALLGMTWQDFEGTVAEHFKRKGFGVVIKGGSGADGGVDVELRKGIELSLVQCKQWRATIVGVDVVRELYGVMAARGAVSGYVVTSANFTPDAKEFAVGRNIHLLDGEMLIREMVENFPAGMPLATPSKIATPVCPKCGGEMVQRIAKKGGNAGQEFWGCRRHPSCKGTRAI